MMYQFQADESQLSKTGDTESTNIMGSEYETSENVSYTHELDEPPVLQSASLENAVDVSQSASSPVLLECDIANGLSESPMELSHDKLVISSEGATEQISVQHGSPNNRRKKGPQKGKKQRTYDDATLQYMLNNIKNASMTVYHAAKHYGVPRTTLAYRLSKKYKHKGTPGPPTVLSDEEEQMIANWVKEQERKGFSITRQCVATKVANYLKEKPRKNNFKNNVPGTSWFKRFSRLYGVLTPKLFSFVSPKVSQANISTWFEQIHQYLVENDLNDILKQPSRMLLCDEISFSVDTATRHVIGIEGRDEASSGSLGGLGVTVLYTLSADGAMIPPNVIVPWIRPRKQNIQTFPADWGVAGTDNGRMDTPNFILYVKKILHPYLVKMGVQLPVLYFVDRKIQVAAMEAADACAKLGIIIIVLYPNAVLGPILRPLKNSWKQVVQAFHKVNGIDKLSIPEFGSLMQSAMKDGLKKSMITDGFRECGLYPFDSNAIDPTKCIARKSVYVPGVGIMEDDSECGDTAQSTVTESNILPAHKVSKKQSTTSGEVGVVTANLNQEGSKQCPQTVSSATLGAQPSMQQILKPIKSWPLSAPENSSCNELISEIKVESTEMLDIKEEPDFGLSEGGQKQSLPYIDVDEIKVEPTEISHTAEEVETNLQFSEPDPVPPLSMPTVTKSKMELTLKKAHCIFCSESIWKHKDEGKIGHGLKEAQRKKIEYVLSVQLDSTTTLWCNKCWRTFEEFYNFKQFCLTALSNTGLLSLSTGMNENISDPKSLGLDKAQQSPSKKLQINKPKPSSVLLSKHSCERCGKSYSSLGSLENHMRNCIKPTELMSCRLCSKTFNTVFKLRNHLIDHGERPYQCRKVDCEKAFLYPHNRSSHEKTCGQPVIFCCLICQQSLESTAALQEHLKSHRESGFQCQICDKVFSDKHHYEKHNLRHFRNKDESRQTDTKETSNNTAVSLTGRSFDANLDTSGCVLAEVVNIQVGELGSDPGADLPLALHSCDLCGIRYSFKEMLTKHQVYCRNKNRSSLGENSEARGDNGTSVVAHLTNLNATLAACGDKEQMEFQDSNDCSTDDKKSAATSGPKSLRQLKTYSPAMLEHIVDRVRNGTLSKYKAFKLYGIAKSTIDYRLSKKYKQVSVIGTLLSPNEEQIIVSRLVDWMKKGFTLTDKRVLYVVSSFMKARPKTDTTNRTLPGKKFIENFISRHPEIKVADAKMSASTSEDSTRKWFDTVQEYLTSNKLTEALHDPSRVFCATEAEFHLELIKRKKSMTALEIVKADQDTTVLFTLAADGSPVPPNVIFPCELLNYDIVKSFPMDWGIINNDTGRINAKNFVSYLKDVVYPSLLKKRVMFPVLYFVKGHTSNTVFEVAEQCAKMGFILLAIPRNTTLQDIHISFTKPLENVWKQMASSKITNSEENLTIAFFASWLQLSMKTTFTQSSIVNEFRTSGLYPFAGDTSDVLMCLVETKSETSSQSDDSDDNR